MRWVSSQLGKLLIEPKAPVLQADFRTGIVELVASSVEFVGYPALWVAMHAREGALIWCDRAKPPYVPAIFQHMTRTILWVRGDTPAAVECLRSKGVGAVILQPSRLSSIEARRLQLAAEQGGGIGILLRKSKTAPSHYAATARYLVQPASGNALTQRWNLTLLHGHGRRIGETVTLELSRETNHLHLSAVAADRSDIAPRTGIAG